MLELCAKYCSKRALVQTNNAIQIIGCLSYNTLSTILMIYIRQKIFKLHHCTVGCIYLLRKETNYLPAPDIILSTIGMKNYLPDSKYSALTF